jgi:hypothetical protein
MGKDKGIKAGVAMIVATYAGATLVLCAALFGSAVLDEPLVAFVDEPQQYGWHTGFVSTMGGMVWWSGVTVCFLTAWIVWDRKGQSFRFWLVAGALTAVLAVDDLFLLHEGPLRTNLHVPEWVTFSLYALAAGAIALVYRRDLRAMPWLMLVLALGFGAVSVALDQAYPGSDLGWEVLLEEGTKFFAITSWTLFFVLSSRSFLTRGGEPSLRASARQSP